MSRTGFAGRLASAFALGVSAWLIFDALAHPETGLLALANIASPFIVLATLAGLAFTSIRGGRWPRIALVALLVVTAFRFGDDWVSVPAPTETAGSTFDVATWNLELGAVGLETMRDGLGTLDADVVALEELTPEQAAAIEDDPTLRQRFPHRALFPAADPWGVGLLSTVPLSDVESFADPARVVATIELDGRGLTLLAAHPFPARIGVATPLRVPVGFDPAARDAALATIRSQIDLLIADGDLVVLGDFNTAPTEPAYDALTAGLTDAHVAVGQGPGWTWRPSRLEFLGMGLLRIDLVLVSRGLRPVASWVDCSRPGDHCLVGATLGRSR